MRGLRYPRGSWGKALGRGGARGLVPAGQPARRNRAGRAGGRWELGAAGLGRGAHGDSLIGDGARGDGRPGAGPTRGIGDSGCFWSVAPGPEPPGRVGA